MKLFIWTILLLVLTESFCSRPKDLEVIHQWRDLEFKFATNFERQYAINNGLYVQGNGVPIDVDVDYRLDGTCRVFTTIPRLKTGIPFSLATVSSNQQTGGPALEPYPSYAWHASHGGSCDGITSVFRVKIDECKRLWVLDTGRIANVQYCAPQLLVFDLRTDEVLHRYRFPADQYKPGASLFIAPIVDVRDPLPAGRCLNTKVYIADVLEHGLIVYDSLTDNSWRIENKLMYPDPDWGTFNIAGDSFDLMDGIFGMALSPPGTRGERYLFFHALASSSENAVPLSVIDNQQNFVNSSNAQADKFKRIGDRGIQSAAEASDSHGNVYFGLMNPLSIVSWNMNTPYQPSSFRTISQNYNNLQFTSAMKVVRNLQGQEELWTLTPRFQKIATNTKNPNEINFRIMGCAIDQLLSEHGTCGGNYGRNSIQQNSQQNLQSNLIFV